MRILVVCGAGASSTFVAQRLLRAAHDSGLDWSTSAGSESSIDPSDPHDVILVGPHLADRLADLQRASTGSAIALLPHDIFADLTGTRTLALVHDAIAGTPTPKGTL